ncbi:uncharacterized protein B0I36DRAFT_157816 [Microdochium trichocladiopsis]|uniref:Uncharacterized protein n=1 Tax=Microdochium trichocladiopsis TaxID=1682393 RepID=A0A9P9BK84_9PEZI|nr:uncharacterized protein B0I36DRAFT_157816 [Microdochium trichocladiopsis]KAH7026379.1 hypothetical protein B0I36DRAFT_157816 [Microdochium trichocladiopsis]
MERSGSGLETEAAATSIYAENSRQPRVRSASLFNKRYGKRRTIGWVLDAASAESRPPSPKPRKCQSCMLEPGGRCPVPHSVVPWGWFMPRARNCGAGSAVRVSAMQRHLQVPTQRAQASNWSALLARQLDFICGAQQSPDYTPGGVNTLRGW